MQGPLELGKVIRRLDTVDSTNLEARRWAARAGAPSGAVVVAGRQTAGRGRRGRGWLSPAGAGLWLSVILRPEEGPSPLVSLLAALATADACRELTGAEPQVKWPNDVVLRGRKIAGILAEAEGSAVIVGVGVNVRQREEDFPPELRETAGSLGMLTGREVSLPALESRLLAGLGRRLGTGPFLDEYRTRCVTLGRAVRVSGPGEDFSGVAEGIDGEGALLVRDSRGMLRRVLAGDVSVRGMMGYA